MVPIVTRISSSLFTRSTPTHPSEVGFCFLRVVVGEVARADLVLFGIWEGGVFRFHPDFVYI